MQCIEREIREELATEERAEKDLGLVENDYSEFHLIMHYFWCSVVSGELKLRAHESAKRLTKETLHYIKWLPANQLILDKIGEIITQMLFNVSFDLHTENENYLINSDITHL